jgi:tetratricopeptide (TPR) repeat protein
MLATAPTELVPAVRDSLQAGILEDAGTTLRFRHDLIREALYESLPTAARGALHIQVARALVEADAPVERIAEQYLRAEPAGGEAVEWLARAARDAASGAPAIAADLLAHALELTPPGDPVRDELLADRAVSLMWCGRLYEAEAICRQVLGRGHDATVEPALRSCLEHILLAGGRVPEAVEQVDAALRSPTLPATYRPRLQAWGSHALMFLGKLDEAVETATRARAAASECNDELSECMAIASTAMVLNFRGEFARAVDLMEEAVRIADRSPGRYAHQFQLNGGRSCST